jgi:hypothetical protein
MTNQNHPVRAACAGVMPTPAVPTAADALRDRPP